MLKDHLTVTDYYFVAGSPFPTALAPLVGKEIESLRAELGRYPVARDVLDQARAKPTSAIAQCFDWDAQAAAEAHWLETGGKILRALRVRLVIEGPTRRPAQHVVIETRAFQRVLPEGPTLNSGPAYVPTVEALSSFNYRGQIIDAALGELDRWRAKHGHLQELDVFLRKIEEADREFGRHPRDPS